MKTSFCLAFTTFAAAVIPAAAQMFTFNPDASIPDPLVTGLTDTHLISSPLTSIGDVNVRLVIAGDTIAANGDFYATLTHGDGFAVLLNRVGRRSGEGYGYPDNGFNINLDDQASNGDIHVYRLTLFGNQTTSVDENYELPLTGSWVADGRDASFATVRDTSPRNIAPLAAFNGMNPNGAWTLFIADVSAGGSGTLVSWSVDITAVPEPAETASIAGLVALAIACERIMRSVRFVHRLLSMWCLLGKKVIHNDN